MHTAKLMDNANLMDTTIDQSHRREDFASFEELPLDKNTFTLFEEQARKTPTRTAIVGEDQELTYQQVLDKANAVCAHFKAIGMKSDDPIGILLKRNADLIPTLLGIWKAGGAYIPFDNEEPIDRLLTKLNICNTRFMLIDREILTQFASHELPSQIKLVIDDEIDRDIITDSTEATAPGGNSLAYYLFTSGSTGTPKAVEVEHLNVIALLYSSKIQLDFGPEDRYLASSTLAFDASVPELYLALVVGGSVLMRDRQIVLDPQRLAKDVRENNVTMVATGPSVWSLILSQAPDFPKIKRLSSQGEALPPDLAVKLSQYADNPFNLYGPTETTVWATAQKLSPDLSTKSPTSAPIGKPFPYVKTLIVDENLKPVDVNVEGELLIGGPFVARGYTGRKDLTDKVFVNLDGERYYRSGDVALLDENNVIHYFGRNDDQMQVKGVRIEPGEVETAILKDHRVKNAATTWYVTPSGNKAIVAAVVPSSGNESVTIDDLHDFAATKLPRELLPSRFIFMESIPVTVNGKVDKKAIRALAEKIQDQTSPKSDSDVDYTDTELKVASIWKKLLKLKYISKKDRFFSLGGDSLAAVQLMLEAERIFKSKLPRNIIFDFDRLDEFSTQIDQQLLSSNANVVDEQPQLVQTLFKEGEHQAIFSINFRVGHNNKESWDWDVPCPLYSLSTWTPEKGLIKAGSIQELGSIFIEAIKSVQPSGPYRLAGFSAGGTIALEIAQQLKRSGDEVEFLFLLDPLEPAGSRSTNLRRIIKGKLSFSGWLNYLHTILIFRKPNGFLRKFSFSRDPLWHAFWFRHSTAFRNYSLQPYDGKAVLIVTRQGNQDGNQAAWESVLPKDTPSYLYDCQHFDVFDTQEYPKKWMKLLSKYVIS